MPGPVNQDAFVDLENELMGSMTRAWHKSYAPLGKKIASAIKSSEFTRAHDLADTINMMPAFNSSRRKIETLSRAALLLGAKNVNGNVRDTKVFNDSPDELIDSMIDQFGLIIERSGHEHVIANAHKSITAAQKLIQEIDADAIVKADPISIPTTPDLVNRVSSGVKVGITSQVTALSQQLGIRAIAADNTRVKIATNGADFFSLGASVHSNRVRSMGFLIEADARSVSTYIVNAVLDARTTEICETMNGRVFDVRQNLEKMTQIAETNDPDALKSITPWPRQNKDNIAALVGKSNDDLAGLGLSLPPYHPLCRTVISLTSQVIEKGPVSVSKLSGEEILRPSNKRVADAARGIHARAKLDRPAMKEALSALLGDDAVLEGTRFQLKSQKSLRRKLLKVMREDSLTFEEAILDIGDSLRYTMSIKNLAYADKVNEVLLTLEARGYRVKPNGLRNSWNSKKTPSYQGINVNIETPSGLKTELQFHTPESFHLKNKINHPLYEEARDLATSAARVDALEAQMIKNQKGIAVPPRAERIKLTNLEMPVIIDEEEILRGVDKLRQLSSSNQIEVSNTLHKFLDESTTLQGLIFQRKEADSLKRKITNLVKEEGMTVAEAVADIGDALRYTYEINDLAYFEKVNEVLSMLKTEGYVIPTNGLRNTWSSTKTPMYQGINVNIKTKQGFTIEIQFHTSRSFHVKQFTNHPLYEEMRNIGTSVSRIEALEAQMIKNQHGVPVLQEWETITSSNLRMPVIQDGISLNDRLISIKNVTGADPDSVDVLAGIIKRKRNLIQDSGRVSKEFTKVTEIINSMSNVELASIYDYTDDGYKFLNTNLRFSLHEILEGQKTQSLNASVHILVDTMNEALDKLPNFKGTTFRGVSLNAEEALIADTKYIKGSIINEETFISTSIRPEIANEFDLRYRFVYESRTGTNIKPLSAVPKEDEIMFKANTQFLVKDVVKDTINIIGQGQDLPRITYFLEEVP